MNRKKSIILSLFILAVQATFAQPPRYTIKHFVSADNPKEFIRINPLKDGFYRDYQLTIMEIWDLDDRNTTYVKTGRKVLVCIEGELKNGQRQGLFTTYIMDSLDHKKRYKLREQQYEGNRLNGEWRNYTLKGNLVSFQTFKNDSLNGIARSYWIDGKAVMDEREYFNGQGKYTLKEYEPGGQLMKESQVVNGVPNGLAKRYYPSGKIRDEVMLVNGLPNGLRKYYFPSGKLWVEQEMKNGSPWTVIANYTEDGQKRDPGTLKDGNGTVILYNEKGGTIRETLVYRNGKLVE